VIKVTDDYIPVKFLFVDIQTGEVIDHIQARRNVQHGIVTKDLWQQKLIQGTIILQALTIG
jgi:aspartate carbamoyltransferase regulatory subunit